MELSWEATSKSFKAQMIGKLLGDGGITKQSGRRPRFQYTHVFSDYDYNKFCHSHLAQYIPLNPPKYKKTIDPRLNIGYSLSHYTQSRTDNIITYLRSTWYPNNSKILPYQLINEYFNLESLAWWYMDDGHLKINNNVPEKIVLSTDSFQTIENQWLINFLHEKYNLLFSLDKQNRLILYDQFQIHYFLHQVTPYLHESMHRKIIPFCNIKHDTPPRRTTIYLPKTCVVNKPTKDINAALQSLPGIISDYKKGLFYSKYTDQLFAKETTQTTSYQIVITESNLATMQFMRDLTGLNMSRITELSFSYNDC